MAHPVAHRRTAAPGTRFKFGPVRFLRRWPVVPLLVLLTLVVLAAFAPQIAPHDPIEQTLRAKNAPPFWNQAWYEEHPRVEQRYLLGADHVGRDVLSRLVHGARISLMVASVALTSGLLVGATLGVLSGWYGGVVDEIIGRIVDIWYSLPFLLIALVVVIVVGQGIAIMMGLLALVAWTGFVRNVRAEVLSLRERDYIALAKVAGASNNHILVRHIVPGVVNTIVVIASLNVGNLILTEATLSFLGAGIPAPTPAWGLMVAEGRDDLISAWWVSFFPGLAIFLVVMSLNFMGDWLRDRLDPRLRQLD